MDKPEKRIPSGTPNDSFMHRYRIRILVALICVSLGFCAIYFFIFRGWINSSIDSLRFGDQHRFSLDLAQVHLTEEDAVAFAKRTLELEGYELSNWEMRSEGFQSIPPTGEKDRFLTRGSDPTSGRIQFVKANTNGTERRFVEVSISDGEIVTYIWMPK